MSAIEQALEMHEKWNGKIETTAKSHVNSREDLAIAYTPGVTEPCKVIAKDPDAAYKYTMKANTIAVVSDGSAVLGLGDHYTAPASVATITTSLFLSFQTSRSFDPLRLRYDGRGALRTARGILV